MAHRIVRPAPALGILSGVLLLVAAGAHAVAGWPVMRTALRAAGVAPDLIGALAVGWLFGSVAMATFGVVVLILARAVHRRTPVSLAGVWVIGLAFFLFGAVTFILRHFKPHFLTFVILGALVLTFAVAARTERRRRQE